MSAHFNVTSVIGCLGVMMSIAVHVRDVGDQHAAATQPTPARVLQSRQAWAALANAASPMGLQSVPPPIPERDLDRYAEIVVLSEEQRLYLARFHQEYLAECDRLERECVPKVKGILKDYQPGQASPTYFETVTRWFAFEKDICDRLSVAEDQMFMALELVLSDPQRERMTRVRLHRERAREMPPKWRGLLEAKIDLARLVEQMPWSVGLRQSAEVVLWEYEQTYTPLLVAVNAAFRDAILKEEGLRHSARFDPQGQSYDRTRPETVARSREVVEEMAHFDAIHAAMQRRLAAVNLTYLPRLLASLPSSESRVLENTFLAKAYARVYPDANDPESLYQDILADERLPDDLRPLLAAEWDIYRREYETICEKMVSQTRQWHEVMTGRVRPDAAHAHNQLMNAYSASRELGSEKFVRKLIGLLPPEVKRDKQSLIDRWQAELARNREIAHSKAETEIDIR